MPSRRQYSGNASAQTLTADLTSVATTATISSSTGWPNGAVGPFAVVIDRGTNSEEKCLCSGLSGNTLTFQTRGYDGTGGAAHTNGADVELCLTAVDLDEANAHTSAVAGVHGISGNVVGTTDSQTLANKTFVQPTITDYQNATHDHTTNGQGGVLSGYVQAATAGLRAFVTASPVSATYAGLGQAIPHGAPFTPKICIVQLTDWTFTWTTVSSTGVDATNVTVNIMNGGATASAGTFHANILSFG